jgi:hypothetical protein
MQKSTKRTRPLRGVNREVCSKKGFDRSGRVRDERLPDNKELDKSWWLKYAHRQGCRSWPLLIFWRRRDWRRGVRMMLQILLHRLVAQQEPESSLRGHIDGLLQIQFVQVNHVFD